MLKTQSYQNPWLNFSWSSNEEQFLLQTRELLTFKARENSFTECVVAWSPDHGFSREERLCKRDNNKWFYSVDSHRGILPEREAKWQDRVNTLIHLLAQRVEPLSSGVCKFFRPQPKFTPEGKHIIDWSHLLFWYNQANNCLVIAQCDSELEEALMWARGIDVNEWRKLCELQKQGERYRQSRCIYCGCRLGLISYVFLKKKACPNCEKRQQTEN